VADKITDKCLGNNQQYAKGKAIHKPVHPGKQPIQPAKRLAVVACMDARIDVEDLLGLQTGEAHIIRNAGGVVTDDAIRCLIISHHLLNTNEVILIHHTRCGMLAFTDDLLKAGLEGDRAAEKLLGQATGRKFKSCKKSAATPGAFHAFRGPLEPLDAPRDAKQTERLAWDVRRGIIDTESPMDTDERRGRDHGARVHLRRRYRETRGSDLPRTDGRALIRDPVVDAPLEYR
jgi:carbonic anhydrase